MEGISVSQGSFLYSPVIPLRVGLLLRSVPLASLWHHFSGNPEASFAYETQRWSSPRAAILRRPPIPPLR